MTKVQAVKTPDAKRPAKQIYRSATAVDGYATSTIPAGEITSKGALTEHDLGKVYVQVLHNISMTRVAGLYTDSERQAMADTARGFYDSLIEAISGKKAR